MTREPTLDQRVARLSAEQLGVFARKQVMALGATRGTINRRIEAGRWERLGRDVFRLAGTGQSWAQALMTALLSWGDDAVISHLAAAALWRYPSFEPEPVEVTVPPSRRRAGPGIVHRNALSPIDVTRIGAIRVTTPARTLLDIASIVPRERLEDAIDDALRGGLVSVPRLRWSTARAARSGRPGIVMLRALIEERDRGAVPQSVLESRLLRAMRDAGIPEPVRQYPVRDRGRLVAVVDFAFPDIRLAVEADGYRWHSSRARWEHDRERASNLTALGWGIVHVTWEQLLRRPHAVVASINRAIERHAARNAEWR